MSFFAVSQLTLSETMGLSSSVISDYESGRRKSPGAKFIRRFVLSLLLIDEGKGSRFIREFAKLTSSPSMAVVDLREFPIPVRIEYLCRAIGGEVVACKDKYVKEVNGYTVIDSTKAVETYSGSEYAQLFGASTDRALSFHKRGSRMLAHDDCPSQQPKTADCSFPQNPTRRRSHTHS